MIGCSPSWSYVGICDILKIFNCWQNCELGILNQTKIKRVPRASDVKLSQADQASELQGSSIHRPSSRPLYHSSVLVTSHCRQLVKAPRELHRLDMGPALYALLETPQADAEAFVHSTPEGHPMLAKWASPQMLNCISRYSSLRPSIVCEAETLRQKGNEAS